MICCVCCLKGQMNQNPDIFSLAILKPRNVEQIKIFKRNLIQNFFFFLNREKEVKSSKYEDSRWFRENVSKVATQFNGKNGTETCDVILVLNIAAFLRQ